MGRRRQSLHNAPHTAEDLADPEWNHCYTREEAVYPLRVYGSTNTGLQSIVSIMFLETVMLFVHVLQLKAIRRSRHKYRS